MSSRKSIAVVHRHLIPIVADIFDDLADKTSERDRDILAVLESLTELYTLLESDEYVFTAAQSASFYTNVWRLLVHHRALRIAAGDRKLWNDVPKFHYLWHVAEDARFSNPRFGWCYPDEDFMRIVKATCVLK